MIQISKPDDQIPYGKKIGSRFYCNQKIYKRTQPDNSTKLLWVLQKVGGTDPVSQFLNSREPNYIKHYVETGIFESEKNYLWKLRLLPFSSEDGGGSPF